MFEIEDGIPAPETVTGFPKYPFAALKVGQSFLVPHSLAAAATEAAKKFRQRHKGWDHRFSDTQAGRRFWRVA